MGAMPLGELLRSQRPFKNSIRDLIKRFAPQLMGMRIDSGGSNLAQQRRPQELGRLMKLGLGHSGRPRLVSKNTRVLVVPNQIETLAKLSKDTRIGPTDRLSNTLKK